MRKHYRGLSGLLLTMILPLPGHAAEAPVDMGVMTVTATKSAREIDGVSATVEVIDEKAIESSGAATLKDIFEKSPGLSLQYGTFPSASSASKSSVSIRGIGATGTLFLLDGRRLSGEVKNPYDLDRIPAGMIERIEIIKGPMSVLYGADATGGVINIITKQPKQGFSGSVGLRGGMNSDGDAAAMNADVSLRGKQDRWGYSLTLDTQSSEPYTERERTSTRLKTANGLVPPSRHPHPAASRIHDTYDVDVTYRDDAEVHTVGGRVTYDLLPSTVLGVEMNYFTEERTGVYRSTYFPTALSSGSSRIPASDTPVESQDDNWRRDIAADLRSTITSDLTLNARVYNSYYEKRNSTTALNWRDAGFASKQASESLDMNADVAIWTYEAFAVYSPATRHLLTMGGEYRDESRDATVFNQRGTFENRSADYMAGYIQDEWRITDSLSATLGARYDDISNADDKATFKVGLVNEWSKAFILRGNFAQGYRTPDIRELYITKSTPAGAQRGATVTDPLLGKQPFDLKPEFVNSYEVGLAGSRSGWHYNAAVFHNDISDKIEQVTKNPGTTSTYYTFENISDATTQGVEFSLGYDFASGIGIDLGWYELDTENEQTGNDLEFNPERQISLRLKYATDRFEGWIQGKHVGQQYAQAADDQWIDAYFLMNAGASYALGAKKQYELYGGVNNILDETVEKLIGSDVGPFFYLGTRVKF